MAKSRDINLWDGFDGREIVYDDKKEKRYHSRIWSILGLIAGLVIIILIYQIGVEMVYKIKGNTIEAEYYEDGGKIFAKYYDEKGNLRTRDMSSFFSAAHDGDTITLYYTTDITKARPLSDMKDWFKYFAFFAIMLGICLWRLYVIWHPKQHAFVDEESQARSRFDD